MSPIILKTKYAFHSLLWLLKPNLVLDIGSMDGADSKRFRKLLKSADIVAFEASPDNYKLMSEDKELIKDEVRVINQLVSIKEGTQSFFVQRPDSNLGNFNRGMSSARPRNESGMKNEEVQVSAVRIDTFIRNEHPKASSAAIWVDVEGFAFEVLESMQHSTETIKLIHVEVETQECWPGQKLERDVVRLLEKMGYVLLAHGENDVQRDLLLVSKSWYESSDRKKIDLVLKIASFAGPALSRALSIFPV